MAQGSVFTPLPLTSAESLAGVVMEVPTETSDVFENSKRRELILVIPEIPSVGPAETVLTQSLPGAVR